MLYICSFKFEVLRCASLLVFGDEEHLVRNTYTHLWIYGYMYIYRVNP